MGAMNRILVILTLSAVLAGCQTVMVRAPDGTEMPADVYAHVASVEAVKAQANDSDACYQAAGSASDDQKALAIAMCALASKSGGQVQIPTYQRAPSGFDKFVGTIQALSPLISTGIQAYVSDRASERNTELQLGLASITAQREAAIVSSIGAMNAAGYNALQGTATAGYSTLGQTTVAGYDALEGTATAGYGMGSSIANGGFDAIASIVASQPPTYQLGDGSMIITGDGNTSQTGDGAIDQSQVGRDRDVNRECIATASSTATGTSSGTAAGTTGPFATGGAIAQYPQVLPSNECGN